MPAGAPIVLVTVATAEAELAADALWVAGAAAVEERPGPSADLVTLVADVAPADPSASWVVEHAVVDDGLDAWRAHAGVWRAGRFTVTPPWLAATGDVVLMIDPGHAFGSGSHPTTRLVLGALDHIVGAGDAVLDVGCGSGVLAIASASLEAAKVDAIDIDPEALAATTANAAANGWAEVVHASDALLAELTGPYDVVAANIGAASLRDLAGDIERVLAADGRVVLSGVLADDVDSVVAAFAGSRVVEQHEEGGWVAVVLAPGTA